MNLKGLKISLLIVFLMVGFNSEAQTNDNFSGRVATDFIRRFPDPDTIHWVGQSNHFSWQAGYIVFAMEKMWLSTRDSIYFKYIKRYVDQQVDDAGNVPDFKNNALDNFLPGYAILFMYEQTKLEKYKIAATHIRNGFNGYPRAGNGLFWHASDNWARNQVWVDGVFMGQIFLARYGKVIGDSEYAFGEVVNQMIQIIKKCQKENGLLLHGWNESKTAKWADKTTGLAPEVWSEGLGWFAVLIADVFDYLPENQSGRKELMVALQKICVGLKNTQDQKTGMWCQVVDKCNEPGNWNETSGTGMFIYLLQKAIDKGYISKAEFKPVVEKAYNGIIKKAVVNKQGYIDLIECSSIGIQNTYADYIAQPKEVSPFAAFGSFIIGTCIAEKRTAPSFVCTDYTQGKVFIVSAEGKAEWEYPAENCNDVWVLPNGNLLFNTGHGVKEVTRNKEVVFSFESKNEIYACQRLPGGNTFIGECNSGRLLEVNPKGNIVKSIPLLPEGGDGGHSYMRNARKLENGNYLVAHYGLDKVCEYNSDGKLVREIPVKGGPHSVIRLSDGNTLIACSDHNGEPRIVEVDKTGTIVWQLTKNELPGIELKFMTGMQCLPNGNLVLTNWLGHNQFGKAPHAFEITRDKEVVWIYNDNTFLKTMSSIQLIDSHGMPINDKALH